MFSRQLKPQSVSHKTPYLHKNEEEKTRKKRKRKTEEPFRYQKLHLYTYPQIRSRGFPAVLVDDDVLGGGPDALLRLAGFPLALVVVAVVAAVPLPPDP